MSGFAGVVSIDGEHPADGLLERMAARLEFRGPDGIHTWNKPGTAFCFAFCRTGPGVQSKTQPVTLDGKVWLLGDVRLDGRADLSAQLARKGEILSSEPSDEELILHAWRVWGESSLPQLLGDFAFVLWEPEAKRLSCVRDLMGAKPFFFAYASGRFYFSNMLDVVRLAPEVSSRLDLSFIGDFLLQAWCPDPERTAFRDIRRLPAGHLLVLSADDVQVRRYARLPIEEPVSKRRDEELVEEFRALLGQAVRDRLPENSAAIFLSGGLDSSTVAGVAQRIPKNSGAGPAIRAYTVDYTPLFPDEEGRYASEVAKHLGIEIEILSAAAIEPYSGWDQLRLPEPSNEPFLLVDIEQYRQAAAHARVAFTGHGGDDIMTGQAWPHLRYLLRKGRVFSVAKKLGSFFGHNRHLPPLRAGIRTTLRRWTAAPSDPLASYPKWIAPHFEEKLHLKERWRDLQRPAESRHPLHPVAYAALSSSFWPSMFEGEDAAWTGVPVEIRTPLLDLRILRFLLRIPPLPLNIDKEMLRRAATGLLPKQIIERKKTPLLGDPLALYVESRRWNPAEHVSLEATVQEFVDSGRLRATFEQSEGFLTLWADVRPISLSFWLKVVEKTHRIQ